MEMKELLNWSPYETDVIRKNIQFLREIKEINTDEDHLNVFNSFSFLLSFIPVKKRICDKGLITRCRPNENGIDYTDEWELSYNKYYRWRIGLNRFNLKGETMFYGSLPNENKKSKVGIDSSLESYKIIVDGTSIIPYHEVTYSFWRVKEVFEVVDLTFEETEDQPEIIKQWIRNDINGIKECCSEEVFNLVCDFRKFICEISFNTYESSTSYILTNLLFDSIKGCLYDNDFKVSGLIYPGSMTKGIGTNIVLFPTVVDTCLKIEKVSVYRFVRNPKDNMSYVGVPICDEVDVVNSKFKIERWSEEKIDSYLIPLLNTTK